jgi:hypothetical protein
MLKQRLCGDVIVFIPRLLFTPRFVAEQLRGDRVPQPGVPFCY